MKATVDDVRGKALAMSPDERAALAHALLLSLDAPDSLELDAVTEAEVARRVRMVREGKAGGRLAARVFGDVEAKYGCCTDSPSSLST